MAGGEDHEAPAPPEDLYHISYILSYKVKYSLSMHSNIIPLQWNKLKILSIQKVHMNVYSIT